MLARLTLNLIEYLKIELTHADNAIESWIIPACLCFDLTRTGLSNLGNGQYINIVSYHDMRQDMVTDFGFRYVLIWCNCSFPGWRGFITVKWCDFLNLSDCSRCSFIYSYPLINHCWLFIKKCHWVNTLLNHHSHPYKTVSVLQ